MANDATAVRVAGNTQIYLAPVGTAFPDFDDDMATATPWTDLGYVTTDGVTWNFGREVTDIEAMQSGEPIRTVSTKLPKTLAFALMEAGQKQFQVAMGGGTWVEEGTATGIWRYEPPDVSELAETAVVVEMVDGTAKYRYHVKRSQQREAVEHKYTRDAAATLPITLSVLAAPDGGKPFYILSDDDAVAA